jgi:microcystin-dependent protein
MTLKFNSLPRKTLSENITSSATSFSLSDILDWNDEALTSADFGTEAYGVFHDAKNTVVEFFAFDPSTIADSEIDFTYRGLALNGENLTTEVTANKREWSKGTYVELGTHAPQMFQWLKEYIDGIAVAGAPDASATGKGLVEVAVLAEVDADTRLGSTGAVLAVPPDVLALSKYGLLVSSFTGVILPYAGTTAPTGFLLCDGSAVSRTTYATLYAITGDAYGAGNGSTTFNVPDLRSSFPLGGGTARTRIITFVGDSGVDPATDTITVTSNDWLHTGQAVALTGSSLPTGLSAGTYYVIRTSATAIKLAANVANANAGTAVDITADGSGTCTLTQTLTARTVGATGGEETHALTDAEMASHHHQVLSDDDGSGSGATITFTTTYEGDDAALTDTRGSDSPHNVMNPYTVVSYIIKT